VQYLPQFSQQTIKAFSDYGQLLFSLAAHPINQANETHLILRSKTMKRLALAGLTAIALATATAPAFASINPTPIAQHRTNLSNPTKAERQATLDDKLNARFKRAIQHNQDATNLSDPTKTERQATLDSK
jgi:hypothetical protein